MTFSGDTFIYLLAIKAFQVWNLVLFDLISN